MEQFLKQPSYIPKTKITVNEYLREEKLPQAKNNFFSMFAFHEFTATGGGYGGISPLDMDAAGLKKSWRNIADCTNGRSRGRYSNHNGRGFELHSNLCF